MPNESPTRMSGTPTSSNNRVIGKSYAVRAAIFSRPFILRMDSALILDRAITFWLLGKKYCKNGMEHRHFLTARSKGMKVKKLLILPPLFSRNKIANEG